VARQVKGKIEIADLDPLDIDTVIIAGVDMQGRLFGKRMSPRMFVAKLEEGLHVCTCVYAWDMGQSLEGLHVDLAGAHTGWHDFRLVPDVGTLRVAAWLENTAICLADSVDEHTGELLTIAPRTLLRRQVESLEQSGWYPYTATELEFYLYRGKPSELRVGGYRDMIPTTLVHADYNISEGNEMEPFFRGLRSALDDSAIPVEVSQAEYGLGQWEINLEYTDALEMADRHVLFKQAVKDHAIRHGLTATFMPRPMTDDLGSSCHIHASLRGANGEAVFYDKNAERGVSDALRHAVGGLLKHAADLMLWYAPTINSYRRIGSKDFAGNGLTWGFDNRTTTARVLVGSASATRLEFRLPGADVNPYLALAAVLGSLHDGIRNRIEPGPPRIGDAYEELQATLPRTLTESAGAFSVSTFAEATFGKDAVKHYHAVAAYEWDQFLHAVTDWERMRYLEGI
jgi:glutamine synthetase